MAAGPFNTITFASDDLPGVRVALTLEDEWVVTAGLRPNVNRAIVPYREYELIADRSPTGTVEFWNTQDPFDSGGEGTPDVQLAKWTIVEVEPVMQGATPSSLNDRVLVY